MKYSYYFHEWDIFISYASEDKETIARPLAEALEREGLKVWFDDFCLRLGDSLSQSINRGLSRSKYGVVILSPHFLRKQWPQKELAALVALENRDRKLILPVWHDIGIEELRQQMPILADRVAVKSSVGLSGIVKALLQTVNLPFSGPGISGLWIGGSGRLRLFQSGDKVEGDYDWLGHDWVGHLHGFIEADIFRFEWWWDVTSERGNGYFEHQTWGYNVEHHSLKGGWAMHYEGIDVWNNSPKHLRKIVHEWEFTRFHESV